jgi:UDP-GlcNAc:undecaprenyl-phosphate/decaprenyl-phosphate GlcNAc-1-phosphate transferase
LSFPTPNNMTLTIQISIAFIIGLLIVYQSIPIIVKLSNEKKLFDLPNERKVNKTVIPNLGGIALFIGITIATLLGINKYSSPDLRYILVSLIIMFFIGIKDDILIISAYKKLIAQIVASLILIVLGDIRFTNLHGIFGIYEINYIISVAISLVALVSIINAVNLIDGIDGLAVSLGLIGSLFYGIIFLLDNLTLYAVLSFAIAGSLTSFFFYNVFGKKNKIFMGDTGSLMLGLLLAIFTIKYNEFSIAGNSELSQNSPAYSFAIIAVPLFDMVRVFGTRILKKKSPFAPDMIHIHHKLLRLDFTHLKSTLIIAGANLLLIGMVFSFRSVNVYILIGMLISMLAFLSFIPDIAYEYRKSKKSRAKKLQFSYIFTPLKNFSSIRREATQYSMPKPRIGIKWQMAKKEKIA